MLSLLCFCVIPFSSENKDLYIAISNINFYSPKKKTVEHKKTQQRKLKYKQSENCENSDFYIQSHY